MKEAAVGTSWAMTAHVGLVAAMPTDDLLMVYDDGAESVFETQQTCVRTSQALAIHGMLDRRTQYHPLSATINNPSDSEHAVGPQRIILSADGVGEQDSAADG